MFRGYPHHQSTPHRSDGYAGASSARASSTDTPIHEQDKDFLQHVLSWPLAELKQPLPCVQQMGALRASSDSHTKYYQQFMPLILEEARSMLAEGLERKNKHQSQTFRLTLTDQVEPSRRQGNPCILSFSGSMPREDEHSNTMNALWITSKKHWKDQGVTMLVLASSNPDSRTIKAKALIKLGTFQHNEEAFRRGQKWQAYYLGSLVTQERMFKACANQAKPACLAQIVQANLVQLNIDHARHGHGQHQANQLNLMQQQAVERFVNGCSNGTMLLQGPPGTGKTTTITQLLQNLAQNAQHHHGKTLVTAPSNKAIQVLAERFLKNSPDQPAILAGVEQKLPEHLKPMFLHTWKGYMLQLYAQALTQLPSTPKIKQDDQSQLETKRTWALTQLDQTIATLQTIAQQLKMRKFEQCYTAPNHSEIEQIICSIQTYKATIARFTPLAPIANAPPQRQPQAAMYGPPASTPSILEAMKAKPASMHMHRQLLPALIMPLHPANITPSPDSKTNTPTPVKQFLTIISPMISSLRDQITRSQTKLSSSSNDTIEAHLLRQSKTVFSTLSVSGRQHMMENLGAIDALIVDEASQCVEAETLIAFQHYPQRVLLVGDTKQLPATVQSEHAKEKHFDWSMMWRLAEENQCPSMMLTQQYRMHEAICRWPSNQYYGGALETSRTDIPQHLTQAANPEDHPNVPTLLFRPRAFYDLKSTESKPHGSHSFQNHAEADMIAAMVKHIRQKDKNSTIGVITFYAAQVELLKKQLKGHLKNLRIHTVDGFQGDECDAIIVSCVRTTKIGFLNDFRRLNVAITRAKNNLIVLGHTQALSKFPSDLKQMIADMRAHQEIISEGNLRTTLGLAPQPKPKSRAQRTTKGAAATKQPTRAQKPQPHKPHAKQTRKKEGKKAPPSDNHCRFFNGQSGSCQKGDQCKFMHAHSNQP